MKAPGTRAGRGAAARRGHRSAALAALAAAALLAGCEQAPVKPQGERPPPVNLSGYSQAFREGFKDGCDTARGKARRDEKRYGADAQYARGWDDGASICARR